MNCFNKEQFSPFPTVYVIIDIIAEIALLTLHCTIYLNHVRIFIYVISVVAMYITTINQNCQFCIYL